MSVKIHAELSKNVSSKMTRIAIVDEKKCKPNKCKQECKRSCPVQSRGVDCIDVTPTSKIASISEINCTGCGICPNKCPFHAITIINLPTNLEKETIHRYGQNTFKLHRLPFPKLGHVVGIVGVNGIGKSTVLKILSHKTLPNFGEFDAKTQLTKKEISRKFRGSDLQNYFLKEMKVFIKPQHIETVTKVPSIQNQTVKQLLDKYTERTDTDRNNIITTLDLEKLYERKIANLSGGELQRVTCACVCLRQADVYIYDEVSNYLDVKQRMKVGKLIKSMSNEKNYILVVEHDLSLLDYMSDLIHIMYGVPGAYGVVTKSPFSMGEGINVYMDGYIPTENMRFRSEAFDFKMIKRDKEQKEAEKKEGVVEKVIDVSVQNYPAMTKTLGAFKLEIQAGSFNKNAGITVLLGENGTGKTTFLKLLAGIIKPDDEKIELPRLTVSYKPQHIDYLDNPDWKHFTVQQMLNTKISALYHHAGFKTDVLKPMEIDAMEDYEIGHLSGGEKQKLAIVLCLGKPADVYVIDEPSSFLDVEARVNCAKAIKNFIVHSQKSAFIVEHDIMMGIYLAYEYFGQVVVFSGEPSIKALADKPQGLVEGMNNFLKQLGISFRQDKNNNRPRVNKEGSMKDTEQKKAGQYFYIGD